MTTKKILLFALLHFSVATLFSQTLINGTVLSGDDKQPLPGVSVIVKGSNAGAITDFDGAYSVKVPEGKTTLVFSYVGFKNQEIEIDGKSSVNCLLMPETNALDEVVVIGYGAAKKGEITGAIATISSEALEDRPVARIEQALAGQMAGVRVRANTGDLGAPLEIIVRGKTSISADNKPLYVVDGFPTEDIGDLVTADIESISVLKDAAQAAIYGSRGANGVVIITTKKGKSGKAKINYSGYFGMQTVEKKIDLLTADEWIDLNKEVINKRWVNLGEQRGLDYKATDDADFRLQELGGEFNIRYMHDPRWETGEGLAYIDWQDELLRTAPVQEHQLSTSGATDNVNYYVSGTYFKQDGIIKYTDYNRVNFRTNLRVKLNEKFSLTMNLSPTTSTVNGGRVTGKDASVHHALTMAPVAEASAGLETGVKPHPNYMYAGSTTSPVAYMREITYQQDELRMRSNVALEYKILPELRAKITGGLDNRSLKLHRYLPTHVQKKNWNEEEGALSSAMLQTNRDNKYLLQGTLDYSKKFAKKHQVNALLGYSVEGRERDNSFQKHGLINNDKLTTFHETTSTPINSFYQMYEDRMISYFARASYDYDHRYLVSGSVRKDGSSRFGSDNLWGVFPSISFGWRIENESFMEDVDFISNLKLRYSYGETGNNTIPWYRSFAEMTSSSYSFGNQVAYGLAPGALENQDLGWETTLSSNFGLDFGILKNRFFMSFDYYVKETSDMLFFVPVPYATGFTNGWQNIGSMKNSGWEFELTTKNLVGDFKWQTSLNFSHNENEILSMGPDDTPILAGFQGQTQIHQVGETMFSFFMYDAIGVYQDQADVDNSPSLATNIPGDVKYRDVNGDGIINTEDKTIVGDPQPDYFWGMTNVFSYKNLELSVLLQGQMGGHIYSILGRGADSPNGATTHNRPAHWINRWRSETDTGDGSVPRIDGTTTALYDTRWLYDATFWKVKNVTLTYKIPNNIVPGISNATVYMSGENLFMQYEYEYGYSPEANNNDGGDYGGYPLARVISLGCKLQF